MILTIGCITCLENNTRVTATVEIAGNVGTIIIFFFSVKTDA
jgi:hypothetical protein